MLTVNKSVDDIDVAINKHLVVAQQNLGHRRVEMLDSVPSVIHSYVDVSGGIRAGRGHFKQVRTAGRRAHSSRVITSHGSSVCGNVSLKKSSQSSQSGTACQDLLREVTVDLAKPKPRNITTTT
jgi:hypothetical protein